MKLFSVIFAVVMLLAAIAIAQDVQTQQELQVLRVSGFSGLNLVDIYPGSQEATTAHNVDLSRSGIGVIAKRRGFGLVDTITVIDSVLHLEALQFDDGRKFMMVIGAVDSGLGKIFVSNESSVNFEADSLTELYSRLPITGEIYVEKLRDRFYVTTGVAKGVIVGRKGNNWQVRPFPMVASGEPIIVPFKAATDTTTYSFTGTVRYMFKVDGKGVFDDAGNPASLPTAPVKVQNGRVYITHWQYMHPDTSNVMDSNKVDLYRSKTDMGSLDAGDYAYRIPGQIWNATPEALATAVFIDSLPDSALSTTDSIKMLDDAFYGYDENGTRADTVDRRYGAPGYVGRVNWTAADTMDNNDSIGVYWGWSEPEGVLNAQGVAYATALIDTFYNIESDLGASLNIVRDQDDTVKSYTLSFTRPPTTLDNITINLYRAALRVTTHTSRQIVQDRPGSGFGFWTFFGQGVSWWFFNETDLERYNEIYGPPDSIKWDIVSGWEDVLIIDTTHTGLWYRLAQISDTSTTYVDTLRQDSLVARGHRYRINDVPPYMASTFAYNSRLYGVDGNRLYRSDAGEVGSWGLFEKVDVDPGRDQITRAWPSQFALRVAKALSNYNVVESEFVDEEIVGRWGCVAPRSLAFSPAGPIYLSTGGVVLETDGQFLERTIVPGILSEELGNFSNKTLTELKSAVGQWLPREQQYWLNIGDTTWVWDLQATKRLKKNVWTTSSIDFAGGTLYDVTDDLEVVPGRSFYFFRDGDPRIYQYGEGIASPEIDYDVGDIGFTQIVLFYISGPMLWNRQGTQVTSVNAMFNFDGTVADSSESIVIRLADEANTQQSTWIFENLYNRYQKLENTNTPAEIFHRYEVTTQGIDSVVESSTGIELLEFYYKPDAEEIDYNE